MARDGGDATCEQEPSYVEYVHPRTGQAYRVPLDLHSSGMLSNSELQVARQPGGVNQVPSTAGVREYARSFFGACLGMDDSAEVDTGALGASDTDQERVREQPALQDITDQLNNYKSITIDRMSSEAIRARKTDLTPGTVKAWAAWTVPAVGAKTKTWLRHLELDPEAFEDECMRNPVLRAEDEHNADVLAAMLNDTSEHVKAFKGNIIKTDPSASISGYKLYHAILASEKVGKGAKREGRVKEFEAKHFFSKGMKAESFVVAADTALAEFELLPPEKRAEQNADLKMLLGKMPTEMCAIVDKYRKKLAKREALDESPKWAYDELVAELAFECCPSGFHANVAKALGDKPKVCVNCGEGHDVKDKKCTKRCDECGSNICPKIRGDVCVVTAEEMPSQHDIKNAVGGRTPDHVYKWLKELRAEKREKMGLDKQARTIKAAASIADAETSTRFTMW